MNNAAKKKQVKWMSSKDNPNYEFRKEEEQIKQLKKDMIKGHAKNKYKNQGIQFTADQVVASLQDEIAMNKGKK